MNQNNGITFNGIANITPSVSTFSDVVKLHGSGYEVRHISAERSPGWFLPERSLIRYRDLGLTALFIVPNGKLLPESVVSVAGASTGCLLQTEHGIHVGMAWTEAMLIVNQVYSVREKFSDCIEITPTDNYSELFLALHHFEGYIECIGLHHSPIERPSIKMMNSSNSKLR